jgi:cytoplasmic iron level regulating protein YaaA (DUF328/UPF0246 family)
VKWTGILAQKALEVKMIPLKSDYFSQFCYNPSQKKTPHMKILLAPSETKQSGGDHLFAIDALMFDPLLPVRQSILHAYMNALQRKDLAQLSKMFGLKQPADIAYHAAKDLPNEPAMPAIERYTGVAFDHLDYPTLSEPAKAYLHHNLILHSNLFGFLRADDLIPEYRLKQGEPIGNLLPEHLYREHGSVLMDAYIGEEDILDLRATFYNRVYKPPRPYTVLKFLKGGKVVSHWAKAYRGLVLRAIAEAGVKNIENFMQLPIEGLSITEIQTHKHRTEIIYTIET